jgi:hypothetical protein
MGSQHLRIDTRIYHQLDPPPIILSIVCYVCRSAPRISGSANPHLNFVIASEGGMASFPAGTTPFYLQFESARGVLYEKSPARLMTQLTSSTRPLCRSAIPWSALKCPRNVKNNTRKSQVRRLFEKFSSTNLSVVHTKPKHMQVPYV